ncbi:hypothetical protein SKAU_G00270650 [Synaphobranchus kaupii]|uniref:Uncharacterized protein n=1 Tax=Synaphobranchus kaupii TaxID=118154 RepID=A0A9Q1F0J8_SYNKA|nr:hypothetical protein SKAU_G00270650 [Synaphobranchus kaupii]
MEDLEHQEPRAHLDPCWGLQERRVSRVWQGDQGDQVLQVRKANPARRCQIKVHRDPQDPVEIQALQALQVHPDCQGPPASMGPQEQRGILGSPALAYQVLQEKKDSQELQACPEHPVAQAAQDRTAFLGHPGDPVRRASPDMGCQVLRVHQDIRVLKGPPD